VAALAAPRSGSQQPKTERDRAKKKTSGHPAAGFSSARVLLNIPKPTLAERANKETNNESAAEQSPNLLSRPSRLGGWSRVASTSSVRKEQ